MKKIALILVSLLLVCMMFTACDKGNGDTSTAASTPASKTTTSTPAASTPAASTPAASTPAASTPAASTTTPVAVGGLYENLTTAGAGIFTVNGGVDKTGSKADADNATKLFTAWVQLGKDAAAGYSTKSISFTTTSAGTLTVYANRGSSTAVGTEVLMNVVDASGTSVGTIAFPNDGLKAYKKTFAISAAGSYAICCKDNTSSWNVFAIGFAA